MLIALFSQYINRFDIPVPGYSKEREGCYIGRFPLFRLFPVSILGQGQTCNQNINRSLNERTNERTNE